MPKRSHFVEVRVQCRKIWTRKLRGERSQMIVSWLRSSRCLTHRTRNSWRKLRRGVEFMEFRWESAKLQKACPWSCDRVSVSPSLSEALKRETARVRTNLKAASLSAPDFESRFVHETADALKQRTECSRCCKNTTAWRNVAPWPWNHPLRIWSSSSLF